MDSIIDCKFALQYGSHETDRYLLTNLPRVFARQDCAIYECICGTRTIQERQYQHSTLARYQFKRVVRFHRHAYLHGIARIEDVRRVLEQSDTHDENSHVAGAVRAAQEVYAYVKPTSKRKLLFDKLEALSAYFHETSRKLYNSGNDLAIDELNMI